MILVGLVIMALLGCIGGAIGDSKSMGFGNGFALGFFLGIIGIIIASLSKTKEKAELERRQLEELRNKQNN